jgi:RimJ/RimL family protein N-acetyltransferase
VLKHGVLPMRVHPLKPKPMKVYLETNRLLLREATEADVDALFELDSDREVIASAKVMRKLGMHLEGDFVENRFPGDPQPAVRYGISASAWTPITNRRHNW